MVCAVAEVGRVHKGIWGYTTFRITLSPRAVAIDWRDDWDTRFALPGQSWEEVFVWCAERAPHIQFTGFKSACRSAAGRVAAAAAEVDRREAEIEGLG